MSTSLPETKLSLLSRLRHWLNSPWVGGALVIAMIASMRLIAPWSEWLDHLTMADPIWLLLALLAVSVNVLFRVLRMERILPKLKAYRGPHMRIAYAMLCVGQLPTGTLGGDAYRIVKFTNLDVCEKDALSATAIIRAIGFAVTFGVGGAFAMYYLDSAWPLLAIAIALLTFFLLGTSQRPPAFIKRLQVNPDIMAEGDPGLLTRAVLSVRKFLWRTIQQARLMTRTQLAALTGLTLAMMLSRAVVLWLCAISIGLEIGIVGAVFALCGGNIMSTIPSPAGSVGLRESGIVGIFTLLGAATAPAAIASVVFRFVLIAGALAGFGLAVLLWESPATAGANKKTASQI